MSCLNSRLLGLVWVLCGAWVRQQVGVQRASVSGICIEVSGC